MTTTSTEPATTNTDESGILRDLSHLRLFDNISDGNFTMIPNNLIDLASIIESSNFKVITVVYRQLAGFNKQYGWLAISYLAELCGMSRQTIRGSLQSLQSQGLIRFYHSGVNGNTKVYVFLVNQYTTQVIKDIDDGKLTIEDVIGVKKNLVQKVLERIIGKNKTKPDRINTSSSHSDNHDQVTDLTETTKKSIQIKKILKENKLKESSNNIDISVDDSFKISNEERNELSLIIQNLNYNGKTINFNLDLLDVLIKKYESISKTKIIEVVKRQAKYLEFTNIDTQKYSVANIFYKMILEDRNAPASMKTKIQVQQNMKEALPLQNAIKSVFNDTCNDQTDKQTCQMILRHHINKMLKKYEISVSDIDKKILSTNVIKCISKTGFGLTEIADYTIEKSNKIITIIKEAKETGLVTYDENISSILIKQDVKPLEKISNNVSNEDLIYPQIGFKDVLKDLLYNMKS